MDVTAIVHIGSSKAGSSSLQDSLVASREALLGKGVLVPILDGRQLDQFALRDRLAGRLDDAAWMPVRMAVDEQVARHRPRVLVFSAEHLWVHHDRGDRLRSIFGRWAGNLRICLYLREPAAYYLSMVQQRLRATHDMPAPETWRVPYRRRVEGWRATFGEDLTVTAFQPSAFPEGFVESFAARFLAPFGVGRADLAVRRSNETLPAEVVSALQLYHLVNHPGAPRAFTAESRRLRHVLEALAAATGDAAKPRLRADCREEVIAGHAEDLVWLREREGIVFDGLDYEALPQAAETPERIRPPLFSDIVDVDPERRDALVYGALKELAAESVAKRKPAAGPAPARPAGAWRRLARRLRGGRG